MTRSRASVVVALRLALDDGLKGAGFDFQPMHMAETQPLSVLWEATPADMFRLVPRVADGVADPEGRCVDIWITYEPERDGLDVAVEGQRVPNLLRRFGLDDLAVALESAQGLDAELAALAEGFRALFALG